MGKREHWIAKDEIHLHFLHFREGFPSLPRRIWEERLPPEEGRIVAGLAPGPRKWEFLWSRLLLCRLSARYLGVNPRNVKFARRRGGQPFLKGTMLRFSLSHTGGSVACSFGYGRFGIDIERFRDGAEDRARWRVLARRFFSRSERRYIDAHSAGRRRSAAFLEVFTLKEAYGKALGRGLAVLGDRSATLLPARKWRRWGRWEYITGYPVRPGYRIAHIAEVRGDKGCRYRMYSWNRPALTGVFPRDPFPDP